MRVSDVGVVEDVSPTSYVGDDAPFFDQGRRGRRARRRRAERASSDADSDDATLRRLLFGGVGLRGLGGVLVAAGLLVMAAGLFASGWNGPVGAYAEHGGYEQSHMTSRDREYGYAYADYARRFDTGTAWSGWRADPVVWTADPRALVTGGLFCLLGIGLLAAAPRRSIRDND